MWKYYMAQLIVYLTFFGLMTLCLAGITFGVRYVIGHRPVVIELGATLLVAAWIWLSLSWVWRKYVGNERSV